MRTTFTPTPRVDRAIRERTTREGKSLSQVVNELIEQALAKSERPSEPYRVKGRSLGLRAGLDHERFRDLLHEMDEADR